MTVWVKTKRQTLLEWMLEKQIFLYSQFEKQFGKALGTYSTYLCEFRKMGLINKVARGCYKSNIKALNTELERYK